MGGPVDQAGVDIITPALVGGKIIGLGPGHQFGKTTIKLSIAMRGMQGEGGPARAAMVHAKEAKGEHPAGEEILGQIQPGKPVKMGAETGAQGGGPPGKRRGGLHEVGTAGKKDARREAAETMGPGQGGMGAKIGLVQGAVRARGAGERIAGENPRILFEQPEGAGKPGTKVAAEQHVRVEMEQVRMAGGGPAIEVGQARAAAIGAVGQGTVKTKDPPAKRTAMAFRVIRRSNLPGFAGGAKRGG